MNKKLLFFFVTFLGTILFSQHLNSQNDCGTGAPSQQWEDWFQGEVKKYVENRKLNKSQIVNYTIPVVVHIIHFGEPYGTFPNIDSFQVQSQIIALNKDFSGNGFNSANVPAYFANLKANTGIQFCLAAKDPNDVILIERGTDRRSAAASNWESPATPTLNLQQYFQNTIIPNSIWDPVKYLNIWVSDKPANYPINGFGTYPAGSTLPGIFGNNFGTSNNDGIWIWAKAFGTTGSAIAPTNQGRTATHELGHWFGLRHTWGDGNCLSDYCNDTPWSKQAHYGCVTSTAPDLCGVNTAPNGEMTMNFMDRSNDACMYMFTHDQNVRMHVALSQSPNRSQLGAHGKCVTSTSATPTASAVAGFTVPAEQCLNKPFIPFNTSSGFPFPTYVWSSSPAASFGPSATQANPAITITTPGTYTITLVATNSLSSSTYTMLVSATNTCAISPLCLDSIKMIKNVDTLKTYRVANNNLSSACVSGFSGYLTGTNCFKDKEIAQFYPPNSYTNSITNPQVNSVIVLFDSVGTRAANPGTQITCRIYGGSSGTGPVNPIGAGKNDSLAKIVAGTKFTSVGYLGKPNLAVINTKIIPFRFDMITPVIVNANSGFYASISVPSGGQDSINIFSNTKYNTAVDSSAWFMNFNGNWKTYRSNRSAKIQLAIIPQITCSPVVGIRDENSMFTSGVNVMPNPGTGYFSLVFTFQTEQNIQLRVYNSMGQKITDEGLTHVSTNVVDLDLSGQSEGVYFAEISNGVQKTVKKIVISR